MHELGITHQVVEIVCRRAEGRRVKQVTLEIGKLPVVLPDAVRFCFDRCCEGTVAAGSETGEDGTDAFLLEPVPVPDVTQHWSKSVFHSVIESLPDAIVVIDCDGSIRLVHSPSLNCGAVSFAHKNRSP